MSRGYWVKPAGATYAPRRLVSVIVRGKAHGAESRSGRTETVWDSAAACASTFRDGHWTDHATFRADTPDSLHDWLESRATCKSATWIVSPVASSALTLSRFWDRLDVFGAAWAPRGGTRLARRSAPGAASAFPASRLCRAGKPASHPQGDPAAYIFSSCVLRGKPDIVRYTVAGKRLTWVSGMQYLPMDEHAIGATVGFRWLLSGGPKPVGTFRLDDIQDRAELWLLAFQKVCDWWREIDGGPWRPTIGGLAQSYFRRRLSPKTVLAHNDDYARTLEETGVFGGRASTWFYGTVGKPDAPGLDGSTGPTRAPYPVAAGPVEHWDVSSMYPTILAQEVFPVQHLHNWPRPSIPYLRGLMETWPIIARVRLRTDTPEYPFRDGERVSFPTGEFVTTLATPELAYALSSGHVLECSHAASYAPGRPFATAAAELIEHRRTARQSTGESWQTFVKLLSNNFGGKMAQRKSGLTPRPDVFPEAGQTWGGWGEGAGATRKRYVSLAGLVFEVTAARHQGRPLASCFIFLTSYGRALMRDIRAGLPARSVVSQDTDGLWVLAPTDSMRRKAVALARQRGFRLTTRETVPNGRWFGPKHYWTDSGWTLAGIRQDRQWMGNLRFRDDYIVNPVLSTPCRPPLSVMECVRSSDLTVLDRDGRTGPDGWTTPARQG